MCSETRKIAGRPRAPYAASQWASFSSHGRREAYTGFTERARFAENTVRYEATLKFMNGQIKQILSAIQGQ